jgi:SAM-dependent methyltransferase
MPGNGAGPSSSVVTNTPGAIIRVMLEELSARAGIAVPFVDPDSGTPLDLVDGVYVGGGRTYPVVRGIPHFVQSEDYADSFGLEWNAHAETQLDSRTGANISRVRLERCLGCPVEGVKGKRVLEAGCGAGRFTELLVGAGAMVYSIDMSSAVDANRRNIGERPNHVLAQADLNRPPFPPESFDVVLCLGVLQHTPSTRDSLRALWRMVNPGGILVVDHYVWELSRVTQLDPLYRMVIKRLPAETAKRVTDVLTKVFFPLHWALRNHRAAQAALSRISPLYTYMHAYSQLSREDHYEWARLDAYDHLRDRYKRLTTVDRMAGMVRALGAESVEAWPGGNGVEARAIKPVKKSGNLRARLPTV